MRDTHQLRVHREDGRISAIRYALWVHRTSNEIYAVRLQARRISGACGPLAFASLKLRDRCFDGDLSAYDYEDARALARVREQREEFTLLANRLTDYASPGLASPWERPAEPPDGQVQSLAGPAAPARDREAHRSPRAALIPEEAPIEAED